MARVIDYGNARNLTTQPTQTGVAGPPDPTERKFITFATETGAVHTAIVDVEHVVKDAESFLRFIGHARTLVEHYAHLSPVQVIEKAISLLENNAQPQSAPAAKPAENPATQAGGFQ